MEIIKIQELERESKTRCFIINFKINKRKYEYKFKYADTVLFSPDFNKKFDVSISAELKKALKKYVLEHPIE